MRIILASGSPRRKELMQMLPWEYEIIVEETNEIVDYSIKPSANVENIAYQKALAVADKNLNRTVIGADTVVCLNDKIIGKPKDKDDARKTLLMLSGSWHEVYTGVCIINQQRNVLEKFYVKTKVKFSDITETEIEEYILTGEPLDKAGSYGIQGQGSKFIEKIEGDYYNVVGLPINALYNKLKNIVM